MQAGDWVRSLRLDGADAIEVRSFQDLNWHLTRAALNGRRVTLEVTDPQGRRPAERVIDLTQFDAHQIDQRFLRTLGIDGPYSEAILARVLQGGAAEAAGLRDGDHVLAIDGTAVLDVSHLRQLIRRSASSVEPGGAVLVQRWQVDRAGQTMQVEVSPQVERVDGVAVGRIGAMIGGPVAMVQVRHGPVEGLGYAASRVWEVSTLSLQMLWKMLVGDASLRNLSGPITIADYAGQTARMGWAQYVAFLALVSVSLGVLNLLPLPMLDGGHLMYYLFEGLTGRPVSEVWLDRLQRGGLAILLLLMSLAIFNDVARLLGVH